MREGSAGSNPVSATMAEQPELKKRSILLSDEQMRFLERRAEQRGGRRANVSVSSILREWIDSQMAQQKRKQ